MTIVQSLLKFMIATGATWVLWLLILLSIVSVAIMLERAYVFSKIIGTAGNFIEPLAVHLESRDLEKARRLLEQSPSPEARVALAGLRNSEKGAAAAAEAMASARTSCRNQMEERLSFLGTLGNNAPFIGLFGTVVGIIKAFHDLSLESSGGAKAVMAGISEALVATAMGLFVAIPAVLAFNYFQRRIRSTLSSIEGVIHLVLSELKAESRCKQTEGNPAEASS